ncbi:MAG: PepSY-like domain-containing protein [Flavobacteriales bacterium]|jgi:hypothetical protein
MRTAIILFLLISSTCVLGQKPAVTPPAAAKAHVTQHYPKATMKEWKQGGKHFKVEFVLKGEKYTAVYTAEGTWVRTEHNIPKVDLPAAVARALKAGKYGTWKVDGVEQHATPEHASLYKVNVETEKEKAELFFLPDGKLLKEEVKAKKGKS